MEKREITVNLPKDLDPVYTNRIQVAYKDDEFTFVFLHEIPGVNQARAKAVVSLSPKHAKSFSNVLANTMKDYEEKFGEVSPAKNGQPEEDSITIRGYS